jgi:polyphosphate kinase
LIPGVPGMSENITVTRIIYRYLEHGRIFIFHHNGQNEVYLGSADWMNRNIYRRIEVCFPIYDQQIKNELIHLVHIQQQDNTQAVIINEQMDNIPVANTLTHVESQQEIYQFLKNKS